MKIWYSWQRNKQKLVFRIMCRIQKKQWRRTQVECEYILKIISNNAKNSGLRRSFTDLPEATTRRIWEHNRIVSWLSIHVFAIVMRKWRHSQRFSSDTFGSIVEVTISSYWLLETKEFDSIHLRWLIYLDNDDILQ